MQQAEHKTTNVWGLDVHFVEAGEGPVVLLLHGLADYHLSWYCNIDYLADAGYRVIAPDLPGSGESDKPDHLDYNPGSAADFAYDLCQELGISKLSLVGNSAGGLVAGLFALEHPEMVEKLVLVDSAGLGQEVSWMLRTISIPLLGDLIYRPNLNNKMGIIKRLFYQPPAVLDELLPEMNRVKLLPGARNAVLRAIRSSIRLRGLRKQWFILDRLRDAKIPMMVIWGAEDIIIPVAHAKRADKALPRCTTHVIPECGHWPQMEKSSIFNPMLTDFLNSDPAQQENPAS